MHFEVWWKADLPDVLLNRKSEKGWNFQSIYRLIINLANLYIFKVKQRFSSCSQLVWKFPWIISGASGRGSSAALWRLVGCFLARWKRLHLKGVVGVPGGRTQTLVNLFVLFWTLQRKLLIFSICAFVQARVRGVISYPAVSSSSTLGVSCSQRLVSTWILTFQITV